MSVVSRLEIVIEKTEMEKKIGEEIKFPLLHINWILCFCTKLVVNHDRTFRPAVTYDSYSSEKCSSLFH